MKNEILAFEIKSKKTYKDFILKIGGMKNLVFIDFNKLPRKIEVVLFIDEMKKCFSKSEIKDIQELAGGVEVGLNCIYYEKNKFINLFNNNETFQYLMKLKTKRK